MHKQLMRGALAAAGLGVAVTTLAVAPAQAATAIQVRPADLVLVPGTVSGTTGAAKADFLAEGIHIKTTNNTTDAARGYWKVGVPLSQVHTVEYEWFGTRATTPPSNAGEPGLYYNIDIDGDGKADGQLIGELAYGGKDVWLNRDAEDFTGVTPTVPAGFFAGGRPALVPTPRRTATWTAARSPTAPALPRTAPSTTGSAACPRPARRRTSSPPAT